MEKPLAIPGRTSAVATMLEPVGERFHTGFFLRSVPALRRLRDRIDAGEFGSILHASVRVMHDALRTGALDRRHWLADPGLAGYGGFGDLAIHAIDLLRWWGLKIDRPEHVSFGRVDDRLPDGEHFGCATFRLPSGTARVLAGWCGGPGSLLEFELLGTEAAARLSGTSLAVNDARGGREILSDEVVLDAADGLRPWLDGIVSGRWSATIGLADALDANLLLDETYALGESTGPFVGGK